MQTFPAPSILREKKNYAMRLHNEPILLAGSVLPSPVPISLLFTLTSFQLEFLVPKLHPYDAISWQSLTALSGRPPSAHAHYVSACAIAVVCPRACLDTLSVLGGWLGVGVSSTSRNCFSRHGETPRCGCRLYGTVRIQSWRKRGLVPSRSRRKDGRSGSSGLWGRRRAPGP